MSDRNAIRRQSRVFLGGLRDVPELREHVPVLLRYIDATSPGKTASRDLDAPDAETSEGDDTTIVVPVGGPLIPGADLIVAALQAVMNYLQSGAEFMSQPDVQDALQPPEMQAPRSIAGRRMPTKIDRVFYHDPSEREVGPAEVCKVHKLQPGEEMPQLNLSYLTEGATRGSKLHAPWGPGKQGHWWFPDQAG